ncbi:hypothetical protein [Crossiella sp. NPDC003009]
MTGDTASMTREWRAALAWFGVALLVGGLVLGLLPLPGEGPSSLRDGCGSAFDPDGALCATAGNARVPWLVWMFTMGAGLLTAAYAAQFMTENPPEPPPTAAPPSAEV